MHSDDDGEQAEGDGEGPDADDYGCGRGGVRRRSRQGGEETVETADPSRYRVRILSAGEQVRAFEVNGEAATYSASDLAADFPGGLSGAEVAVAQWGEAYGWGVEARSPLT